MKVKVHYLVIPLVLTYLLYVFSLIFVFLPSVKNSIIDKKKEMIKELVNTAWNITDIHNKQVEDSIISLSEAKKTVLEELKVLRYGKDKKDYFWVNDYRPYMIMHPYLPNLNNTNLASYTDPDGTYLFNEMVEIVLHNGEGYVNYKWQHKDDSTIIAPKISFVKGYKPWGWIIGTGVYIDDIEEEIATMKNKLIIISFIITMFVLLLFIYIIKRGIKKDKQLKEIEIKYQKLFESANDGILILKDLKFIDCNSKALQMFECDKNYLIGKGVLDFSPDYQEDGQRSDEKAKKIIEKTLSENSHFFEWIHLTKNGKEFIAEVSLSTIEIGNETLVISFVRDVSKRKSDEKKLIEAMEKAESSDKLKSAFLANMSHEIRTPMNGILGFSQIIYQRDDLEKEKRDEYLKIILNKGNQLMQIINDIIDISKIESNQIAINYTDFYLNELMDELYSFFNIGLLPVKFTLNKGLNAPWDHIISDQTRLTQILTNLLSNAFKFTQNGFIELGYEIRDREIYFYVKDSGIGVKKSDQKIIFDRFRQSDDSATRKYGGTGLGLSISKGLVELLGGNIDVDSDGESGSTFYFTIPYNTADITNSVIAKAADILNDWKNSKILVVEDDEVSYKYLKVLLRETGVELTHVKTGLDALEKIKENNFNLILMDIQLPGMDGLLTTKEIRKFNKNIPIIAQTAYAMMEDKTKSIQAGCNDYLSKPIDAKLLIEKIRGYL